MIRAHLLRWRPRQPAQRTDSTPRRLPSGAASHLDPSHRSSPHFFSDRLPERQIERCCLSGSAPPGARRRSRRPGSPPIRARASRRALDPERGGPLVDRVMIGVLDGPARLLVSRHRRGLRARLLGLGAGIVWILEARGIDQDLCWLGFAAGAPLWLLPLGSLGHLVLLDSSFDTNATARSEPGPPQQVPPSEEAAPVKAARGRHAWGSELRRRCWPFGRKVRAGAHRGDDVREQLRAEVRRDLNRVDIGLHVVEVLQA